MTTPCHDPFDAARAEHAFFAAADNPVLGIDSEGEVRHANQAAASAFGAAAPASLYGANVHTLMQGFSSPESHRAMFEPDWPSRARPFVAAEAIDGQWREWLVSLAALTDAGGETAGWLLSLLDQTESRLAARQRDAALRLMRHDLRAPQASVLALIELWRLDQDAMPIDDLLARIERNVDETLGMVDNFVELAKVESAHGPLVRVELIELTREAVDAEWHEARARKITVLRVGDEPDRAFCTADRGKLATALRQLVRNALRRSPPGSRMSWQWACRGAYWTLVLHDSGSAPSGLTRLDDGSASVRAARSGLDPGLAIVLATAARHGGWVELEQEAALNVLRFVIPR
jgi:signal transduction histidine kinase